MAEKHNAPISPFNAWARGERYNSPNRGINILKQAGDQLGCTLNDNFEIWLNGQLFAKVEGEKCVVYDKNTERPDFIANESWEIVRAYEWFSGQYTD